jgi:predicted metalloendopeptidase
MKVIKNKNLNNKTRKKENFIKSSSILTPEQQEKICKTSLNTFDSFEDKVEDIFKKNKIDIVSSSYNLEKQIIKDIKMAVSPSNIKPNEDFYSYINDRWLSEIELSEDQKYIVQVDDFRLIQHKVYLELIEIIEDYISNPLSKDSKKAKCISNAYKSLQTYNTIEQTICLSNTYVEYLDEVLKDEEKLWDMLGKLNKNEITSWGSPFVWSINPDDKNPKIYKCYLEPPQVTLIDIDIYFDYDNDSEDDKSYKLKYRKKYFEYLHYLFIVAFGEKHEYNIKDVYDVEIEILNAMNCYIIKEEDEDGYNLVTKEVFKSHLCY